MIAESRRDDIIAMYQNIVSEAKRALSKIDDEAIRSASRLPLFVENVSEQLRNIQEPFRLGIVGMFKAGKSSVINSFLNRDVLKEGRTETTAALTEMVFAESPQLERGEVLFKDGTVKKCGDIEEALEYTDIRSGYFHGSDDQRRLEQQKVDRVRIFLHSALLQNVVLLDTPGFGGSEVGNLMAFEALKSVDAALMIFTADRVGADDETRIADELNLRGREIVAMLNQCDDPMKEGEFRGNNHIDECEKFIREKFRTLVKGNGGEALIFRYSAIEVKKILKKAEHSMDDINALKRWGYYPTGENDDEKGASRFLRDRYFSSGTESRKKKMAAAKSALLSEINRLIGGASAEQNRAEVRHKELAGIISRIKKDIEEKILSKIPIIEAELEDEVRTLVREYAKSLSDVIDSMLEEMKDFSVFDAFKREQQMQKDFERRFRLNFPRSQDEILQKKIIRKSDNIFKHHWRQIGHGIDELNMNVEGLNIDGMLEKISEALTMVALHIASVTAAMIALLFIPGGAIVDAIWVGLSSLLGIDSAGKVRRQIAQAQRQARNRVNHESDKIFEASMDELIKINEEHAGRLRSVLSQEGQPAEEESARLMDAVGVLRQVHACFIERLKMVQDYEFVTAPTEEGQ